MSIFVIVRMALRGLSANKMRALLTMLGVIIGVGSVVAMMAVGEGAKRRATRQIESLGVNMLSIRPGMRGMSGARTADIQNLTLDDCDALRAQVPDVAAAAPGIHGSHQVVAGQRNIRTNIVGTTQDYLSARLFRIERGRMFTDDEVDDVRPYAVLGPDVADELFPAGANPIGARILISGRWFIVVGTIQRKGDLDGAGLDNQVYIPVSTAMKRVFGTAAGAAAALKFIHLRMQTAGKDVIAEMEAAERRVENFMRQRHALSENVPSDFYVINNAETLRRYEESGKVFTVLLGSVAGISLLVGGIGIMNIMLVTVTERTKEIGIRKALGARPWDILKQFIIEALVVSVLGGLIGVGAGYGAAALIPKLSEWLPDFPPFDTAPTPEAAVMAFSFAALVGVFFGIYPARRAAKMDPIEALRYE